jgi:hypothetical protein
MEQGTNSELMSDKCEAIRERVGDLFYDTFPDRRAAEEALTLVRLEFREALRVRAEARRQLLKVTTDI